ncbi:hypothetical protein N7532_000107 [Penicillium argentinense]|uniref:Retrovirus-related Pol polyprotein from transposon TNT 1-94-like beta-barrel domain-containing protein n=1 Tax=Penicillium argentinense TaxID=1131581 RepID=A0A9W9G4X3_9EURO|nr:uncharacterized protein N7532_000107 [Penicillium argentinense]KAJ5112062.1 hypothetical protein N7532_000107 [Penicillium argentinense]
MPAHLTESPDRNFAAIEPLTGSDNYATWKHLMTSYLKARQVWDIMSGDLQRPNCLFKYAKPITADIVPLVDERLIGAPRQKAIEARLEAEVQAFERHQEWSKREAEAYHTIFRYLSVEISVHVAGLETSRDLWNDLEERYRRMELATFCELFAQLKETTGSSCTRSIGDHARVAILLTQIGPEYAPIVDAIQNDKDPANPAMIGNRLANAERTVSAKNSPTPPRGAPSVNTVKASIKKCNYCKKRGHEVSKFWKKNPHLRPKWDTGVKTERSVSGSPQNESHQGQAEERQGPPTSYKRPRINIVRARVTTLYTHAPNPRWILDSAATSHICWDRHCFSSFRIHHEMLDTAGDPVEAEGIGTIKLTLRGKINRTLILKNVYYAPRIGMNLISVPKLLRDRYSMIAHPQNVFLQRRGRTIGAAFHTEEDLLILRCYVSKRSRPQVQLARSSSSNNHDNCIEMDIDEPLESSGAPSAVTTSELNSEAQILDEDASRGVDQIPKEALWHARSGHLNRGDLRTVLSQTGTPYQQQTSGRTSGNATVPGLYVGNASRQRWL